MGALGVYASAHLVSRFAGPRCEAAAGTDAAMRAPCCTWRSAILRATCTTLGSALVMVRGARLCCHAARSKPEELRWQR
jgi:hypothetical protein